MFKLGSTILKDIRILTRDRLGLIFMFVMPIVLAVVITAVQNSTFEMLNTNTVPMLICNRDTGEAGKQLETAITKAGMFDLKQVMPDVTDKEISEKMHAKDAVIAIIIPADFTLKIKQKSNETAKKALRNFGMQTDSIINDTSSVQPITLLYHPVLQESFRHSIQGALRSALLMVQNREVLKSLYFSLNETNLPDSLEQELMSSQVAINEVPVSRDGSRNIPNASQHNVPAWTVFAMFFIVISLGGSVVREKLNGSFVRLKTLPTNYLVALISKQITYLLVTFIQAAVVFSIGIWLFPVMGLPKLNLPADITGVVIVTLICGWCAVSYAIMIGVFAKTQEQANGIGAVSIVLMAAVGGLLVPSFAMPDSFTMVMKMSPLHWCLEAYYGLFLEGGKLKDVILNIIPLLGITFVIQLITLYGLKRKNLI
ncbi:MAG: ABC transporter permease [Chitinophagaceae bacterium]|nr:ABC transporter permease [Chitinophagaceae bacterium]MBK7121887.1 ABC transporter permease [Chitinophagaceae bacterium]MBK7558263.1 ABC transporter permease [Chitinophagaceae bacterium]MBK9531966.1 ABC transporter permease [Chitinophagaceae bacterium]